MMDAELYRGTGLSDAIFLRVNGRTVLMIDTNGQLCLAEQAEKDWIGDTEAVKKAALKLRHK